MRSGRRDRSDTIRPYREIMVGAQRLRPQRLHPSLTKKRTTTKSSAVVHWSLWADYHLLGNV